MKDVLENLFEIELENPVDKIVKQIRKLIISGHLKPGDKLPSERNLSEKLGIGRTHVRDAIKKLEFFGVLKTNPQSGTVVSGIDMAAMEGLLFNILKLGENEFVHLVETRVLMETYLCRQAALRRTEEDIVEMRKALANYKSVVTENQPAVNEDFNFHLKIAEASKNTVIKSLMLIIIPDILKIYRKFNVCGDGRFYKSYDEHQLILKCIIDKDPDGAEKAMLLHLNDVIEFSKSFKGEDKIIND
ncbi:MAG: FadR/GntR family transcriptional regulator [Prolixibacteraceae bacterium]